MIFLTLPFVVQNRADRAALAVVERTSLSTQEISSTVTAIPEESNRAVQHMRALSTNMGGSVDLARAPGQSLAPIDQHAETTVEVDHGIAERAREQSAASQAIASLVERIAQAAEATSSWAIAIRERAQSMLCLSAKLLAQLSRFPT